MDTPTIQTRRLILRPLALSDASAIQRHFNNWNVIKNLTSVVPWPYPEDGAETFIKQQLEKITSVKKSINGFWYCSPVMAKR
jgi:ribosomal-protein-alanine N-acetyltransferase